MRPIDANGLKKSITDYHAGLFPRYISKLVDAEIEDIKDIIDEQITLDYAPKQQWISVKDRLPEFRDWVLVIGKFVPEGYWIVPHIAEFRNGVWHSDDIDCTPLEERALTVTHWMPLPEPPKEEAK